MRNFLLPCLLVGSLASTAASLTQEQKPKVSEIWKFPLGTWIENLAVRQNGQILATSLFGPYVYQVDPTGKKPAVIVAKIPSQASAVGITETTKDVFYFVGSNFSMRTGVMGLGSSVVWRLDMSRFNGKHPVALSEIVGFPRAGLLNGLTTLNAKIGILLAADFIKGDVWRINTFTGATKKLPSDPLMKSSAGGVNGLKIRDDTLFWTNTGKKIVAAAPISPKGVITSPAKIIANVTGPDDFVLAGHWDKTKAASGFVAGSDRIERFNGKTVSLVSKAKLLAGSTACEFSRGGRGPRDLYVSTSGGDGQYSAMNITVPGKVVKISF